MAFFVPALMAASAAASAYGASKQPKTATSTTMGIESPEQKSARRLAMLMAQLRIAGVQTPEERREISAAEAASRGQTASNLNKVALMGRQGLSGPMDEMNARVMEASNPAMIDARTGIMKRAYDEAFNTAFKMGMQGPQLGTKSTVPQSNAGAMGEAGNMFGSALGMMGGGGTPGTPAPVVDPSGFAPVAPQPAPSSVTLPTAQVPAINSGIGMSPAMLQFWKNKYGSRSIY